MRDAVTGPAGHPRVLGRRTVLVGTFAAMAVVAVPPAAKAASIGVGDLRFDVPPGITEQPSEVMLGQGWQWVGRTSGTTLLPATTVLARCDLDSSDAGEVLGLLLAGSASGLLPELEVEVLRTRPMPGTGEQGRVNVSYAAQLGLTYHGTVLIATRAAPPTAVVAVLGDASLTAGTIDAILSSVRWRT